MGNRIAKHIVEPNQRIRVANASLAKSRKCGKLLDGTRLSSTYYVLDAQGNPLAMYELDYDASSFELTERQIYGSARLGSLKTKVDVFGTAFTAYSDVITTHAIGDRNYELSNHLGNVLTVVSDKLIPIPDANNIAVASYTADLVMSCDYSPFGVTLDGRGVEGSYRYRFQSQEMDDEIKGEGNSVNYKYRMHDPRVGRFFAVDPLAAKYPYYSTYQFSGNRLIDAVELEGLEPSKNPEDPSWSERYGMAITYIIASQAVTNCDHENSTQFGPTESDDENEQEIHIPPIELSGNYVTGSVLYGMARKRHSDGRIYVTDTKFNSAEKFNMWVAQDFIFNVDEKDSKYLENYEAFVVAALMNNFVTGQGPENVVFPKNGIISNVFINSFVVKSALEKYKTTGDAGPMQIPFGLEQLKEDIFKNGTLFSITGFVGSATITILPVEGGILVHIFNVTSLTSGTLGKEVMGEDYYPISYVRNGIIQGPSGSVQRRVPYGNISQSFSFFLPKGSY